MTDRKRIDEPTGTETVGHEWDGIEELSTPLPRWWLWTFIATVIWGLAYTVFYPAWPLVESATAGTLGWSSRAELQQATAREDARRAPLLRAIATLPLGDVARDPSLMPTALAGGAAAYRAHCIQCHGSGATGSVGYPNLRDDEWLWGGDLEAIRTTLVHGIRNPDHAETRMSLMPAFGRDGILDAATIGDVVSHVRVLGGTERASAAATRGAVTYDANCAVCHGPTGKGDRTVGAPDLTDAIWLYRGSRDAITQSIANSRRGVMPRWGERLDEATIRMLALYIHSLGGGEATPSTAPTAAKPAQETVAP